MKLKIILSICFITLSRLTAFCTSVSEAQSVKTDQIYLADSSYYQIISRGEAAGEYQAFPDACRLQNGDIVSVFYAGGGHVTYPNEKYPKAGRICLVRSKDEGKTWSEPVVIYDDVDDNRDPHISQLSDETLMVTFFSLKLQSEPKKRTPGGVHIIKSDDNGMSWDKKPQTISPSGKGWYCSAPIRELSDGRLLFPVYYMVDNKELAWGGVFLSEDKGKSWSDVVPIGKEAGLFLAAETDVIQLEDGSLFAALRGQKNVPMHYALSKDKGKSWSEVKSTGFLGHSPHLTRLSSGEILLSYRGVKGGESFQWENAYTALRISYNDGANWQGPYLMSESGGAYPSTLELKDNSILMIFYEEGEGSGIGALRFEKPLNNLTPTPEPIEVLPLAQ